MSNENPERDRTEALPAPDRTEALPAPSHPQEPRQEPERLRGPSLGPVILGLVCLVVAGAVLAQEVGNWTIDWGSFGPLGIVAAGAVLVVLGAVGLATSRRRS